MSQNSRAVQTEHCIFTMPLHMHIPSCISPLKQSRKLHGFGCRNRYNGIAEVALVLLESKAPASISCHQDATVTCPRSLHCAVPLPSSLTAWGSQGDRLASKRASPGARPRQTRGSSSLPFTRQSRECDLRSQHSRGLGNPVSGFDNRRADS